MSTYMEEYKRKLITAEQAAKLVQSGDLVDYGVFNSKPVDFDIALAERVGELENVGIRGTASVPPIPQVAVKDPTHKSFYYYSWYFTALDRALAPHQLVNHVPANFSEGYILLSRPMERYLPYWPEVWVAQTCPMDEHGNFNFGIGNAHNRALALQSKRVAIVEVNENMPRCLGGEGEYVNISEIDYIIEGTNQPLFCTPPDAPATPAEEKIAELVMEEIHDGCLIQLGIGSLPNYLGNMIAKSGLKDLGVQTEMFTSAYIEMYKNGCITNRKKAYDRDKSTYTFCYGTQETYDFLDNNPQCGSCTSIYTNLPFRISMHDNVISLNNIVEVDLMGQVCSESSGLRQISGAGGQLDWTQGAFHSMGGKGFLAFTSTYTDKEGNVKSRINPMLTPGSIVTVPRHVVHHLVTENGIICMKGRSIWGMTEGLISLADERFRDELVKEAHKMGIWSRTNKTFL
ncbi:Acetyl-CoA hydrolase/transferase [Syntrophomonas zehnderi OL-4]|uniref:Acetyl-CoA hydrolase/transferase n=1 Tax=Syntrophomonas zehnderi OL-4 TaxID=690567 RepID=A0A0E4GDA8_9FIRM|nr:acetyl-CoA hydrolase/transferase C-terminal domain-containing protein [Syntrophomonas zehnderi]CFX41223.1 Acetyl-CoA hydrolase/transferase [Syntrophomonas zehnderi OL-4]